jgi:hypothetical protein
VTAADVVQAAVDADLAACRRGPSTLDRALADLTREELADRYRIALNRLEYRAMFRTALARDSAARAEAAQERAALLRGGGR